MTTDSIRNAVIDDCDALGLITVTASLKAFIGNVPEDTMDFSWTPTVSAENWHKGFSEVTDRSQRFLVRLVDERVIGYVWAQPWAQTAGYDAGIKGLYVLPSFHGQGIGVELVRYAVRELRDGGAQSLEIGCVRENPSCGFYRHLGGIEIDRRPVTVDAFATLEIFFGWPEIGALAD